MAPPKNFQKPWWWCLDIHGILTAFSTLDRQLCCVMRVAWRPTPTPTCARARARSSLLAALILYLSLLVFFDVCLLLSLLSSSQCSYGFIYDGDQLKVTCFQCRNSFCAQCKKPVSMKCFSVLLGSISHKIISGLYNTLKEHHKQILQSDYTRESILMSHMSTCHKSLT